MRAASPEAASQKPEELILLMSSPTAGQEPRPVGGGTPDTIVRALSRLEVSQATQNGATPFALPTAAAVEAHRRASHAAAQAPYVSMLQVNDLPNQRLPPPEEVGEFLSSLIARDGFAEVTRDLFRVVPLFELMDLSRSLSDHLCGQDCVRYRTSSWTSTKSERKSELDRLGEGSGQQVAGASQP